MRFGGRKVLWLGLALLLSASLLLLLIGPVLTLVLTSSVSSLREAMAHPLVAPAMWLTLRTTLWSLAFVVITGSPLAWLLSRYTGRWVSALQTLVELPIVIPPAVVGIALLLTFGRSGWLVQQGWLSPLAFSTAAVVIAQIVVSAPFFVQSATAAFRSVDPDQLLVARTLGASPAGAFIRVALPTAAPGLMTGAALSWARSAGEFGATLLFAGNMPQRTQTMPLAILSALEADLEVARALALLLGGAAFWTLLLVRRVARIRGAR